MNVLIIGFTSTSPCHGHRPAIHIFGGSSMPKAVVLTKYGPPDVLVWRDVPLPEPGPGQVRIRVKAAGVSPPMRRSAGLCPGRIPASAGRRSRLRGSGRGRRNRSVRLWRQCRGQRREPARRSRGYAEYVLASS